MNDGGDHLSVRLGALSGAYARHRYAILFYSLLLTMVVAPLLKAFGLDLNLITFLLVANLMAAVIPFGAGIYRRVLLGVILVAGSVELSAVSLGQSEIAGLSLLAWTVVAVLGAARATGFALRAPAITREHLYAGLSAYLLAGIFFGLFFWILEHVWPGSFSGVDSTDSGFKIVHGMYFSFITLATVGYGDILPRSDLARGGAVLEAVCGQFYIAVMVARLVSLYTLSEKRTTVSL